MTVEQSISRATMPGFFGAVRELPEPAKSATAVEAIHTPATRESPSYDVLIRNTAERLGPLAPERELSPVMTRRAGLAWTVSMQPIAMRGPSGAREELADFRALIRDDTRKVLDVVSDKYGIVQNGEAFAPFDDIVARGGAEYVGAGSFWEGRMVYAQAKLDCVGEILPGDQVRALVLLSTGHGGGKSYKGVEHDVRLICSNGMTRSEKRGLFSIRHTRNASQRVGDADAMIQQLFARAEKRFSAYRELAARSVTRAECVEFVNTFLPMPADAKALRAIENVKRKRDEVMALLDDGKGTEIAGVRGSAWGLLNAMTAAVDHVWTRRGGSESRLRHIWYGDGADLKERVLEAALRLL